MELKVKSVGHKMATIAQANGDVIERDVYTISAVGKDGFPKVRIEQISPFDGTNVNCVVDIIMKNTQKSLAEFDGLAKKPEEVDAPAEDEEFEMPKKKGKKK